MIVIVAVFTALAFLLSILVVVFPSESSRNIEVIGYLPNVIGIHT